MNRFKFKFLAVTLALGVLLSGCAVHSYSSLAADRQPEAHDVVVIGGGVAGLTAGYYLRDLDVLILEKKGTVGGRTISAMHKSFAYAKGTEYLGIPENPLAQMIDELQLTPREIPSPMDAYFDGDRFYYGNDGIKRYLISNSDAEAYQKFVELINGAYDEYDEIPDLTYNEDAKALDHISAAQWLRDNDTPDVFIQKYNVTAKGLFGATMDEISALSFIPEAAYDYEGNSDEQEESDYEDLDEADLEAEYADAGSEHSGSYSFVKGLTELTDRLGEVLGDKIRLDSTVISVTTQGDSYAVTYFGADGNTTTVLANNIVLAVPAPEALKIASSVLSEEHVEILQTVEYSSYATVALFSDTPIFDKAFDLAVADAYYFTDVYDATWVERFYDRGKTDVEEYIASVYVAPKAGSDHALDSISDEELLDNIYQDLNKIFPGAREKVTGYDIERFPYAYPIMSLGAYERLLDLDELNHGALILAGDYMVYPTFEAAVQSGHLAAERIKENTGR